MKLIISYYQLITLVCILNLVSFTKTSQDKSKQKQALDEKNTKPNKFSKKLPQQDLINFYIKKDESKDENDFDFPEIFLQNIERETNKDPNTERNKNEIMKNIIETKKPNITHVSPVFENRVDVLKDSNINLNKKFSTNNILLDNFEDIMTQNGLNKKNDNIKKDYQLNIYNNFLITNSTITQLLDNFLSSKKILPKNDRLNDLSADEILFNKNNWNNLENIKKEYTEKINSINLSKESVTKNFQEKYDKLVETNEKNQDNNGNENISVLKKKLEKLIGEKEREKESLRKKYQEKINELKKKNKITVEELQKREEELDLLKKKNEKEFLLLKNKEKQVRDLKNLLLKNKIKKENEKIEKKFENNNKENQTEKSINLTKNYNNYKNDSSRSISKEKDDEYLSLEKFTKLNYSKVEIKLEKLNETETNVDTKKIIEGERIYNNPIKKIQDVKDKNKLKKKGLEEERIIETPIILNENDNGELVNLATVNRTTVKVLKSSDLKQKINLKANDNLLYKKLNCIDPKHKDSGHFLMNIEKCRQLNYLYHTLHENFHLLENRIDNFECEHVSCNYDLVINLNDENTIFVIYKTKNKIMQSLFHPSIFHLEKFKLNLLRKDLLDDIFSIYLYPNIARLLKHLPQESFNTISLYIESDTFQSYAKEFKGIIIDSILNVNKIDDRINFEYDLIDYTSIPPTQQKSIRDEDRNKIINKREAFHYIDSGRLDKFNYLGNNLQEQQIFIEGRFNQPIEENYDENESGNNLQNYYFSNKKSDFAGLEKENEISLGDDMYNLLKEKMKESNQPRNLDYSEFYEVPNKIYRNNMNYKKNFIRKNIQKQQINPTDIFNKMNNYNFGYNGLGNSSPRDLYQNGLSVGNNFFDENHLNFFSGFRFKQMEKDSEKIKSKEKSKLLLKEKEKEKTKKQILKEKLISSLEDKKIRNNPCFNKGYYNQDLNFTGSGNFTNCYEFIEKYILKDNSDKIKNKLSKNRMLLNFEINSKNQNFTLKFNSSEKRLENLNISDKFIYLDNQFKNFKFLFYEKDEAENLLVFNEQMQYGILKEKVKDICEKQYSRILADFTKYNIKNLSNLCFDLTYLIKLLDKAQISSDKILIMKTHLNVLNLAKAQNRQSITLSSLFSTQEKRNLILIVIISFLILIILRIFNECITRYLIGRLFETSDIKLEEQLEINEVTINKFMGFQKVKLHLFFKEDSHFKLKYGSDFDPDYYDMILIKHEVLEILRRDSDPVLKKIIIENIKNLNEIRVVLMINLISILVLFAFFICSCLLLNSLQLEFGLLKSLISIIAILFIILVMVICFKLITKIDNFSGNNNEIAKTFSENQDLIVIDKQTLK